MLSETLPLLYVEKKKKKKKSLHIRDEFFRKSDGFNLATGRTTGQADRRNDRDYTECRRGRRHL